MRTLLLLPLLLASTAAFAEDATPEIVVTGQGLGGSPGDLAYDVVSIDRDRLTSIASGRLEDVLRDAAGFQQFRRSDSRSANPTSQGATLRGLGGNASSRALVLLDGVPLTDPFGGWLSFGAVDPQRLGAIRITRGGGSGVYGPGALAGTIELSSATPAQLPPFWGSALYGSRDSVDASAGVLLNSGPGVAMLFGSYDRGDGFTPIVKEDRGPADRPAPYEQWSVGGRAVIGIGGATELQANALVFHDERDRGLAFTRNRNEGFDTSVRLVGSGKWRWEALAYLQQRDFASQFSSVNAPRTTSILTLDQYSVPARGLGARFEVRPPLGSEIELRIGADARQTAGVTRERFAITTTPGLREAGGRTRTIGGFLDASYQPSDALTLTGGARIDRWYIEEGRLIERGIRTPYADRSDWRPTARAGIAFKPVGAITLRGAGYLGWRLPTLNELYRPFRVGADLTNPNPALKPETSRGVDAGVDFRPVSGVRLGATVFWNRLDDAIANVTQAPNTRQRQNLDAIRSQGVEFDAEGHIGAWRLAASYALVDANVRASGQAAPLDGLEPAQVPKHQASGTIGYGAGLFDASATLRYVSSQYEDDQNVRTLHDALTLDATLSVPVTKWVAIEARAENVTDARVEATVSTSATDPRVVEQATPRTFWIGLRFGQRK